MLSQSKEILERHIKTHSERSAEDVAAVTTLENFLNSNGRINCEFSRNDKKPNIDGFFEFVPEPEFNRRPVQTFFVQTYTVSQIILISILYKLKYKN